MKNPSKEELLTQASELITSTLHLYQQLERVKYRTDEVITETFYSANLSPNDLDRVQGILVSGYETQITENEQILVNLFKAFAENCL